MNKYLFDLDPIVLSEDFSHDWRKLIEESIKNKIKNQKGASNDNTFNLSQIDLNEAMKNRRIKALISSLNSFDDNKIKHARAWISLNMWAGSYASLESTHHLLTAASIWILDKIFEQDISPEKLYSLLPTEEKILDAIKNTYFWDCQYDNNLIASVEYILHNRNSDIGQLENDGYGNHRVFTSELAAKQLDHQDVPSRRVFDALISLIPQHIKDNAVNKFINSYQTWIDIFFDGRDFLTKKCFEKRDAANALRKEIKNFLDNLKKNGYILTRVNNGFKLSFPNEAPNDTLINPLNVSGQNNIYISALKSENIRKTINDQLNMYISKYNQSNREFNNFMKYRSDFEEVMLFYDVSTPEEYEVVFGKEAYSIIKDLSISDPYEMCFALLYLIEKDSDIPWLYGPCYGLMNRVITLLPWGIKKYENVSDLCHDNSHPSKTIYSYRRKYNTEDDSVSPSLPQIIYEITGCLVPRDIYFNEKLIDKIKEYKLEEKEETCTLLSSLILEKTKHKKVAKNLDKEYIKSIREGCGKDITSTNETYSELKKKVDDYKEEVQHLHSELHKSQQLSKSLNEKIKQINEDYHFEHEELIALREILFSKNDDIEADNDQNVPLQYNRSNPYMIQKKVIVFCDNEKWKKSLRSIVKGNIEIINQELKDYASKVRNIDLIWINTFGMDHKIYYNILDAAKKHNIPYTLFKTKGVNNCAKLIIENDKQ